MLGLKWTINITTAPGSVFNEPYLRDFLQTDDTNMLFGNQTNSSISRDLQAHLEEEYVATTGAVAQYARVNTITGKLKSERRYVVESTFDLFVSLPDELFGDYNYGGLGFFSLDIIEITIAAMGFRRMSKKRSSLPTKIGNADEGYQNSSDQRGESLNSPQIGDLIRVKLGDNDGWWEITNTTVNYSGVYGVKNYSCSVTKAKNKRYENFDIPYFEDPTTLENEPVARINSTVSDEGKQEPQHRPVYVAVAGNSNDQQSFWEEW